MLIILATVSINAVMGENGLIRKAEKAGEHQANAEAEDRTNLGILDEHLANAIAGTSGNAGGTQTPDEPQNPETLQISYTIEEIDVGSKAVILSYPEELNPTEEELEQIAVDFIVANNFGSTINDFWTLIMGSETTKADVQEIAAEEGMTYEEFLKMILQLEIGVPIISPITITATNGTHQIEGETTEFIATRNGKYTVEVTANDGREAEIEVNVTGIVEEKFSEIYDTTTIYTDTKGETAKIPAGFAVGTSSGINTIAGGLVITDAVDENGYSIGNEYVWIPVGENANDFKRESFKKSTLGRGYTEPYNDGTTYTGYTNEATEYNTMRTQVLAHHGFYIGRYEAGVNTATLRGSATEAQTVVVKKGTAPYNWVPWGTSMSEVGTNGAVYLSQNMYTGKTQANSVTSTLIYGVQWDAMCRYIEEHDSTTPTKSGVDLTGRIGGDNTKNIYDLAGNCGEWTMEAYLSDRVFRGGVYSDSCPVSCRSNVIPDSTDVYNSFRVALYISTPVANEPK